MSGCHAFSFAEELVLDKLVTDFVFDQDDAKKIRFQEKNFVELDESGILILRQQRADNHPDTSILLSCGFFLFRKLTFRFINSVFCQQPELFSGQLNQNLTYKYLL